MVMHEMVHGCRDSHSEHYISRGEIDYCVFELEFVQYPSIYPWLKDALIYENDMLLAALNASTDEECVKYVQQFLSIRKARKSEMADKLGKEYVLLEEEFETAESIARFFEAQSAIMMGNDNPNYKEDSYWLAKGVDNSYFFVTGYKIL